MIIIWILILLFAFFLAYGWRQYIQMYHWRNKVLVTVSNAILGLVIGLIIGLALCGFFM